MLALMMSLVFPGLGQLKNREPRKGFLFAVAFPALIMLAGFSRILLSFTGMVSFLALMIVLRILACVDAFRVARRGIES